MIFPWSKKKQAKVEEEALRPAKENVRKLREERKAAAREVEATLKKILEIKGGHNGDS